MDDVGVPPFQETSISRLGIGMLHLATKEAACHLRAAELHPKNA